MPNSSTHSLRALLVFSFVAATLAQNTNSIATSENIRTSYLAVDVDNGARLRHVRMKTLEVVDSFACSRECLHKSSCKAVLFKNQASRQGLHSCDLLAVRESEADGDEWKSTEDATMIEVQNMSIPSCTAAEKLYGNGHSGVYTITLSPSRPVSVYCDLVTRGGGWTVLQRRLDGSVDFYRDWADYKQGFGNKAGEYWLGLDNMHVMTSQRRYRLRFDMEDFHGNRAFAEYDNFVVGDEDSNYRLTVGSYSGDAADSFHGYHNGQQFTTKDKDNDRDGARNCAVYYSGAWWYNTCYYSNPNGLYNSEVNMKGIVWSTWKAETPLKKIQMKIRQY